MAIEVHVSAILRNRCGGRSTFAVEGKTIQELAEAIDRAHPGFAESMILPDGSIRKEVLISINGELLHPGAGGKAAVQSGDKVHFLSAIAAG